MIAGFRLKRISTILVGTEHDYYEVPYPFFVRPFCDPISKVITA